MIFSLTVVLYDLIENLYDNKVRATMRLFFFVWEILGLNW